MISVLSQWVHLFTISVMVIVLSVSQAAIHALFRFCPFPALLDLVYRHSARIRSTFSLRLSGGTTTADLPLNAEQMIRRGGFPVEEHAVQTRDGFVLGLQRIPRAGRRDRPAQVEFLERRPTVLLMHGLLQNSESLLVDGGSGVLPFLLADAGFDVWLGNTRGNKYSSKHTRLSPDSDAYWDFSLDDLARHDVPAMIRYICRVTGHAKLSYVGFSQGSAQILAALAADPVLGERLRHVVALAPASTVKTMSRSALTSIVEANLGFLNLLFGRRHILAMTHSWQRILSPQRFVAVVDRSMRYLFGWDTREIDPARKLTLYRHVFSLSSVKLVKHWMQVMYSGRFQHFDDTPEPSLPQAAFASIRMLLGGPRSAASSARATKQATASWTEMVVTPGRHPLSALDKRGTARGRGAELEVNPEPEPAQSGGAGAAPLPGPVTRLRAKPRRRTEEGVEEERVPSPTGPKGGMFQSLAPRYDLGAIRSPVTLVYGDRDGLMNVGPMAQRLRRARVFRIDGYEHLDLIWARDAGRTVFPLVVSTLLEAEDAVASPRALRRPQMDRRRPWSDEGEGEGGETAWPPSPPPSTPPGMGAGAGTEWPEEEGEGPSAAFFTGPADTVPPESPLNGGPASAIFPTPSGFGGMVTSPRRAPGTGLPFPSPQFSVTEDGPKGGGGEGRARSTGSASTLDEVATPFSQGSDGDAAAGSHTVGV